MEQGDQDFHHARDSVGQTSGATQPLPQTWIQQENWQFETDTQAKNTGPDSLVFATRPGKPICPNNVLRRSVFPACERLGLQRATWLTFRRTYSSWSHDKGVPGKVVAQLMGHANIDTTLNVSRRCSMGRFVMRSRKSAANCSQLFTNP